MALATSAQSQTQYRVTWLSDPSSPNVTVPTNELVYGTMGINNKGQVCYGYIPNGQSQFRPWVWLPYADYGLPNETVCSTDPNHPSCQKFYDLTTLCDGECDFDLPAIARDLNLEGVVVGQSAGVFIPYNGISFPGVGEGIATLWSLNSFSSLTLGTLQTTGPNAISGAYAINNEAPPMIVGDSTIMRACSLLCTPEDPPPTGSIERYTGFTYEFDGMSQMTALSPGGTRSINRAYDVNTPSSGSPLIPGTTRCMEAVSSVPCTGGPNDEEGGFPCLPNNRWPTVWFGNSAPIQIDSFESDIDMFPVGVNDNGELVGYGQKTFNEVQCYELAAYWPTYDAEPIVLPSTFDNVLRNAKAMAINNLELPTGVGWAEEKAVVWDKTGLSPADWSVTYLDDLLFGGSTNHWTIIEAHDINDSNWIVGIARRIDVTPNITCTVLLTPGEWPCPVDVNQDGCVNSTDLVGVIADYGKGISYVTNADINGDSIVNVTDLLAVIAGYCSSQAVPCCSSCPGGEGGGGEGLMEGTELSAAMVIELILLSNHDSMVQSEMIQAVLEYFSY